MSAYTVKIIMFKKKSQILYSKVLLQIYAYIRLSSGDGRGRGVNLDIIRKVKKMLNCIFKSNCSPTLKVR